MIYLSERDLWKAGKTMYTVEKKLSGTEIPYSDGMHIIFANAEANDGTEMCEISEKIYNEGGADGRNEGRLEIQKETDNRHSDPRRS